MTTELTATGNPQGKGLVGVIDDFHRSTPMNVTAKSPHQWLADYFTSILVLNAECMLKPVIDTSYYLYLKNDIWKLSLIEPTAWNVDVSGIYFAECILHADRTWSVTPKEHWQQCEALLVTIKRIQNEFISSLDNEKPLEEQLPFYNARLPYYRRISANALARSLKKSLQLTLGEDSSLKISGNTLLNQVDQNDHLLIKKQK